MDKPQNPKARFTYASRSAFVIGLLPILIMVLLIGSPPTALASAPDDAHAAGASALDIDPDDGLWGQDDLKDDDRKLAPLAGMSIEVEEVWRHVALSLAEGQSERTLYYIEREYGVRLASRSKLGYMFGVYLYESTGDRDARYLAEKMAGDPRIAFVEAMQLAKLASAVPFDNYVWSIITPSELMEQYAFDMLDMGEMGGGEGGGSGKSGFGADLDGFSTALRGTVVGDTAESRIMAAREAIGDAPVMSTNRLLELYGSGSAAHGITRGAGVTVAVIDTGFDRDHPALDGAWTHPSTHVDFVDNDADPEEEANGLDDDGDGEIDEAYGHGTFVAGIVHLMAPDAQIMPIRVLDDDGQAHEYEVAMAINHAMANDADIINLSLVIPNHSSLLQNTLENAAQAGVTVIAAAGNEGVQTIHYPAGDDCAVAVTAIDEVKIKSDFANYGGWVDLTAPGEAVYSAFPVTPIPESPGEYYYYAAWSGSSVATPFVAGHAALLQSLDPLMGSGMLSRYLAAPAISVDPENPAYSGLLGRGLPQVLDSLDDLLNGPLPGAQHDLLAACPTAY